MEKKFYLQAAMGAKEILMNLKRAFVEEEYLDEEYEDWADWARSEEDEHAKGMVFAALLHTAEFFGFQDNRTFGGDGAFGEAQNELRRHPRFMSMDKRARFNLRRDLSAEFAEYSELFACLNDAESVLDGDAGVDLIAVGASAIRVFRRDRNGVGMMSYMMALQPDKARSWVDAAIADIDAYIDMASNEDGDDAAVAEPAGAFAPEYVGDADDEEDDGADFVSEVAYARDQVAECERLLNESKEADRLHKAARAHLAWASDYRDKEYDVRRSEEYLAEARLDLALALQKAGDSAA